MSLVVCLFLQLSFSAFWSDAQLTTSDQDCGKDFNANLESIRQSVQIIHDTVEQQKCSSQNGQTNPCPAGFNYSVSAVNKCYAVVLQPTNWDAAQEKCRALNPKAHLAIINSPLENQIISEMLNDHDCRGSNNRNWFWTSGRRQDITTCDSPLAWKSNPRNNQAIGYTNWCPREPNCAKATIAQHCLTFAKRCYSNANINGWQDDTCSNNQCPICEVLRV